jgi:hypothetical protein
VFVRSLVVLVVVAASALIALVCVAALLEIAARGRAIPLARSAWRLVIGSLALAVVGHLGFVYGMRATNRQLADYYLGEATIIAVVFFWEFVAITLLGAFLLTIFLRHRRSIQRSALLEYAAGAVVVIVAAVETIAFPFAPASVRGSPFLLVGALVGAATDRVLSRRRAD